MIFETLPSTLSNSNNTGQSPRGLCATPEYCMPYHAAKLVDSQIDRVRAHRWTRVTSDNQLFQNLLRTYFVHEYAYIPIFPRICFWKT